MFKKRSTSLPQIAIIGHRNIGDTIFIEPVIRVLMESEIDLILFVKSEEAKKIANLFFYPPPTVVFKNSNELKKSLLIFQPDVTYHFDRALISAWVSFRVRVPWRFGVGTEGRWLFLSQILFKKKKEHHSHEHLRVFTHSLKKLSPHYNIKKILVNWKKLTPSPLLKNKTATKIKEKYLLIHLGTTRSAKNIPLKIYKNFINVKKKEYSQIWLCGNDEETAKKLLPLVNRSYVNQTSFDEFCFLIKKASEIISPDTSAMHIAAAYGVKVIGVFGSTDPHLTGPLGPTTKTIFKKVNCSPCFRMECRFKKSDQRWMQCMNIEKLLI